MANEDFGAGIDRLNALIPDDLYTLVDSTSRAAIIGWGTLFNVVDYVRGLRALHAADACSAATPLLRAALEYTMCTIWLADAGEEAVEVLNRGLASNHKLLRENLTAADLARFPKEHVENFEAVAATDLGPHPDQTLLHFTHLLEAYGFTKWVPAYAIMSSTSHGTGSGAQRFFSFTDEAVALGQSVRFAEPLGPCEVWGFGLLFDTLIHYDLLLTGRPWTADLKTIADDYEYPYRVVRRKPKASRSGRRSSRNRQSGSKHTKASP